MIVQDHSRNKINKFSHPIPTKLSIKPFRGSKTYLTYISLSLRRKLTQKTTNFNPYKKKSQMQKLTHTATENPSINVHGNQPNVYDINIQREAFNKGMHLANILKGKLNIEQKTNTLWLVTTVKAILKRPIQKSEKPIF